MHVAFPDVKSIYISIANSSTRERGLHGEQLDSPKTAGGRRVELVTIPDAKTHSIGPAAGLLAAHQLDPDATWLIVACDFPLLEPAALHQLEETFEEPVTCFVNKDGFSEPLLAIWSPRALQILSKNVDNGRSGPSYTVKRLSGKLVVPTEDSWILNTNTPGEWEDARMRIRSPQSTSGA
ncbi:molybdenum cofactor biosynthesis protein C [Stagonosporopsis vannaccii]|nr:molybdenum cofactor biosynthesis protein C [Stagonosporopsis vannaccii]